MHTVELSSEGNEALIQIQKHRGSKKKEEKNSCIYQNGNEKRNSKEKKRKEKHTHTLRRNVSGVGSLEIFVLFANT